jgi:hypothetical protein
MFRKRPRISCPTKQAAGFSRKTSLHWVNYGLISYLRINAIKKLVLQIICYLKCNPPLYQQRDYLSNFFVFISWIHLHKCHHDLPYQCPCLKLRWRSLSWGVCVMFSWTVSYSRDLGFESRPGHWLSYQRLECCLKVAHFLTRCF